MRRFIYNFVYRYRMFMQGRYGMDELNVFMLFVAVACLILSRTGVYLFWLFHVLSLILLALITIRMYSRNISKRYEEKTKFLKAKSKFMAWCNIRRDAWRNRKTHYYFRCKKCRASIRVPKRVGKIEVTCPNCKTKVIKKT